MIRLSPPDTATRSRLLHHSPGHDPLLQGAYGRGADHAAVGDHAHPANAETLAQTVENRDQRGHVDGVARPHLRTDRPAVPSEANARHDLMEILVIALCTMLCGGEDCTDMALFGRSKEPFLRQFLRLRHGIPSHDTFCGVFRLLDPVKFHAFFLGFMQRFAETTEGVVAIDGKTLRHSFDRAAGGSALHLVSAWAAEQRLVLGQLATVSTASRTRRVRHSVRLSGCHLW